MELVRWLLAIVFCQCIYMTLAENNYKDIPIDSRITNVTEITTNTSGETKQQYHCDELNNSGRHNRRTRREIRTLVDMQKANAKKLDDIASGFNKLDTVVDMQNANAKKLDDIASGFNKLDTVVDMQKANAKMLDDIANGVNKSDILIDVQKANTKILENIANGVNKLANSSVSTDKINPIFISMFLMLADVFQSTSPRITKDQTDFVRIMDYIIPTIVDKEDSKFLRNGLSSIVDWYAVSNYSSCLDLLNAGHTKSGVYIIRIPSTNKFVIVYCDQETDGGGWLVFQRRKDGSEDFYRSWEEYRRGFGNISGEFWLGNDILHELTKTNQELRVDLTDFAGNTAYAKYSSFSVGSPSDSFPLSISGYSGTAGDSMKIHNGYRFYTKDKDNAEKCAVTYHGAWWYRSCHNSNLNGLYKDREISGSDGITWYHWKNAHKSLKGSEMKIRPKI